MAKAEITEVKPKKYKSLPFEKLNENNFLHSLTRLFEKESKSCTAACLIDDVIVLADNNIHSESKENSQKMLLIKNTMQYFSEIDNNIDFKKNEEYMRKRNNVLTDLCKSRIKGEEIGYIKLEDKLILKIIEDVCARDDWREKWHGQNAEIDKFNPAHRAYIAAALEITENIKNDFNRIEMLLTQERVSPELEDLVKAFKGGEKTQVDIHTSGGIYKHYKGNIKDPGIDNQGAGYVIVKFDVNGIHAETRLLEYLMITGVLENIEGELYVAISKLCCAGCDKFLKEVSTVYNQEVTNSTHSEEISGLEINYKGAHLRQFDWKQPIILKSKKERFSHSYLEIDKKGKKHLKFVVEGQDLPENVETFEYEYIDNKIIEKLKSECVELANDSKIGDIHLAEHSGDEISSTNSSPSSVTSMDDNNVDKANSLINQLKKLSKSGELNEDHYKMLGDIVSQVENVQKKQPENSQLSKRKLSPDADVYEGNSPKRRKLNTPPHITSTISDAKNIGQQIPKLSSSEDNKSSQISPSSSPTSPGRLMS